MANENVTEKMPPARVTISPEDKLLIGRREAADMLSISRTALDYLVANKQLIPRIIGARVLIPVAALRPFAPGERPARLAGCCALRLNHCLGKGFGKRTPAPPTSVPAAGSCHAT